MIYYEDDYCYYFWKEHGIASSWGNERCFLDMIKESFEDVCKYLVDEFGEEEEYGLLNRLDNDTAGLLYFAKNKETKEQWKELQKQGKIIKYYLADLRGNVDIDRQLIASNIAHHPSNKDRMIVCDRNYTNSKSSSIDKANSSVSDTDMANKKIINPSTKWIKCETWIEKLFYDEEKNYSCFLVMINRGARHQIRIHLASIGCPIIGEKIYKKKKDKEILHLWSVGVETGWQRMVGM